MIGLASESLGLSMSWTRPYSMLTESSSDIFREAVLWGVFSPKKKGGRKPSEYWLGCEDNICWTDSGWCGIKDQYSNGFATRGIYLNYTGLFFYPFLLGFGDFRSG